MKLKQSKSSEPVYRIQALDRALDILESFSYQNRRQKLSEVASKTGLNKATAKRILAHLTDRGYLSMNPETKRYSLGLRLFELGGVVHSGFSVRKAAARHMTELRDRTGMTILLAQIQDDQLVYIDKREASGTVRISSEIGIRRPLHFGMLGQILMAYLPEKEIERLLDTYPLEPYTPNTITDRDAFSLRLAEIRKWGYLMEKDEAHQGVMGIAAPIRDWTRRVIASMGVAIPLLENTGKNHL